MLSFLHPLSRDGCDVFEDLHRAARDAAEVVYAGEVGDLDSAAAHLSLQTECSSCARIVLGAYQVPATKAMINTAEKTMRVRSVTVS